MTSCAPATPAENRRTANPQKRRAGGQMKSRGGRHGSALAVMVSLPSFRLAVSLSVRAGVCLVVALLQAVRRHVRINLRRAQAAVAQQLLDAADVRAVIQQVRGEAVA